MSVPVATVASTSRVQRPAAGIGSRQKSIGEGRPLRTGELGPTRVTSVDAEVAGLSLMAETVVHPATMAANRDLQVFVQRDRFDITAVSVTPSLTCGGGVDFCAGLALASTAMKEAVSALASNATIAPLGSVMWQPFAAVRGPVEFDIELSRR